MVSVVKRFQSKLLRLVFLLHQSTSDWHDSKDSSLAFGTCVFPLFPPCWKKKLSRLDWMIQMISSNKLTSTAGLRINNSLLYFTHFMKFSYINTKLFTAVCYSINKPTKNYKYFCQYKASWHFWKRLTER